VVVLAVVVEDDERLAVVLVEELAAWSLAQVIGPTTPSWVRPFCFWKSLTACAVCGPNWLSTATLYPWFTNAVWICLTPDPLSPRWTLALGLLTTRPAAVVVVAPGTVVGAVCPGAADEAADVSAPLAPVAPVAPVAPLVPLAPLGPLALDVDAPAGVLDAVVLLVDPGDEPSEHETSVNAASPAITKPSRRRARVVIRVHPPPSKPSPHSGA
jgi:hypothetical protein